MSATAAAGSPFRCWRILRSRSPVAASSSSIVRSLRSQVFEDVERLGQGENDGLECPVAALTHPLERVGGFGLYYRDRQYETAYFPCRFRYLLLLFARGGAADSPHIPWIVDGNRGGTKLAWEMDGAGSARQAQFCPRDVGTYERLGGVTDAGNLVGRTASSGLAGHIRRTNRGACVFGQVDGISGRSGYNDASADAATRD
jgi:hypothetical protein